jgi:SAM-dependent methyltransferase
MPASAPPFVPRRFRTTVPFYAKYRLAYPDALIARVAEAMKLAPGDPVLDLGCGPGLLAIPFARLGMRVTGVDPEPDMLEAARMEAQDAQVAIDLRQASSFDLPAGIGPFRLVTMGRSFHWMDRAATLSMLDGLVPAGGAVALFDDRHVKTAENNWLSALKTVGQRFGAEEGPHRIARQQSDYRAHISYLFASPFCDIFSISVYIRREISAADVIGYAHSTSVMSPEALGQLREALAQASPDGRLVEIAEMEAMIARKR